MNLHLGFVLLPLVPYFLTFLRLTLASCDICVNPVCLFSDEQNILNVTFTNVSAANIDFVSKQLNENFSNVNLNRLELINCSLTTLPGHAFQNIKTIFFRTTCPFSEFPTDVVRSMKCFQKLYLENTTFINFPSDLPFVIQLYGLYVVRHKVKALNTELRNFPYILILVLNYGDLEELSKDAFVGTPDLLFISLQYNRLKHLHIDTLKPVRKVQVILLKGNHLYSADGLFDSIRPVEINLSDNKLTSVEKVFNRTVPTLKKFLIAKNPIQSINFKLVSVAPHLRVFDMSETGCRKMNSNFFYLSRNLTVLNLSHNSLESVPDLRACKYLTSVDLSHNFITSIEGLFRSIMPLYEVFLSHNQISEIKQAFHCHLSLNSIDLSENTIKYLSNNNFICLYSLQNLDLSGNKIEYIESQSFFHLGRNLNFLSLTGNRFTKLNGSLQNLFELRILFIDSTLLESLDRDEFLGLRKLFYLNLENNSMKSLNGALQNLHNLEILNIAENNLTEVSRYNFPEKVVLKKLQFAGNKQLHCDCRLKWIIQWLAETNNTGLQDDPVCHFPLRLRGQPVKELILKDIVQWPEDCPQPCYCECDSQGSDLFVKADCSGKNITDMPEVFPPNLRFLNLSKNELGPTVNLSFNWAHDLTVLDLEQNKITSLEVNTPQSMEELRLAGNLLKRFPWSAFSNESLKVLTLRNNPWICDCETVDFRKLLLSGGNPVLDVNETKCGPDGPFPNLYGEVITVVRDTDLCPSILSVYFIVALGITGFLVTAVSMRVVYLRYHLYIKVWLYAHGYTWVKEDDIDTEKLFDSFVSYHRTAESFVLELSARLEQEEPKFILCIPERDIVCGEFSAIAEMKAVKDSKRIIVVLNEEYINDMYCMSIFHEAFRQSLKDKVHRVILIRMCNITKTEDISPELKVALDSTSCISFEKELFWERLRYAMPKKVKIQREPSRVYTAHFQE